MIGTCLSFVQPIIQDQEIFYTGLDAIANSVFLPERLREAIIEGRAIP